MPRAINEFRQDIISGAWVLFVTGRTHSLRKDDDKNTHQKIEGCPFEFEDFKNSEHDIVWKYPDQDNWQAVVIKNKFPAVKQKLCTVQKEYGPFKIFDPIGDHEIVVYRDHERDIYKFNTDDFINMIKVYKKRFTELLSDIECTKYIMIFHNHGYAAGASIFHPHSQIITTPILPPDVSRSLYGSFEYYQKHKKNVYAELLEWEQKERTRIIYENEEFIALCPYFSKYPYEVRIYSKVGHAHFHQMPDEKDKYFADIILTALQKLKVVLDEPPFNMFIHTAPVANEFGVSTHEFYHWHMEIIPHLKIDAGFEIGTGIEINVTNPDDSAEALRGVKI